MAKAKVAVLKTNPNTVIDDYGRLMHLANYQQFLPKDKETALKTNISWEHFYPACSTTPWQLDGVISTLLKDGYCKEKLYAAVNRTVVVDSKRGEVANKHKQVTRINSVCATSICRKRVRSGPTMSPKQRCSSWTRSTRRESEFRSG